MKRKLDFILGMICIILFFFIFVAALLLVFYIAEYLYAIDALGFLF